MRRILLVYLLCTPLVTLFAQNESISVGKILIDRNDIFSTGTPTDNQFPYSWANKIHVVSKEEFIRRDILFHEGDALDMSLILESERILRARGLYRHVSIKVLEPVNGSADVHIQTDDVWSTKVYASYHAAGGKNLYGFGLAEDNLLGHGIRAGTFVEQEIDRFVKGVNLGIPHFLRPRWELLAGYGQDEAGREWELFLRKPYFSFYSEDSHGLRVVDSEDEGRLFANGNEIASFQHNKVVTRGYLSRVVKPPQTTAHRFFLVHEYQEDEFYDPYFPFGGDRPVNRKVSVPMLGYQFKERAYIKERGVTTFDRDEDINLGWDIFLEAGPSLESLGATQDGALGRIEINRAWNPFASHYLLLMAKGESREEEGRAQNAIAEFVTRYTVVDWWRNNTAFLKASATWGRNLDAETQFLLGGEKGLRGYSVRQFSGSKKILLNCENRQLLVRDLWHLVSVGWATFVDTGAVWREGENLALDQFKTDVGVGLRFSLTRSLRANLVRLDAAYALNDNNRSSRLVANIGVDLAIGFQEKRKFEQ